MATKEAAVALVATAEHLGAPPHELALAPAAAVLRASHEPLTLALLDTSDGSTAIDRAEAARMKAQARRRVVATRPVAVGRTAR
jgi:hypothetical protein